MPKELTCLINLQHDCSAAGCNKTSKKPCMMERDASTDTCKFLQHNEQKPWFVVNTQSLHNYQEIAEVIPTHLHGYLVIDENWQGVCLAAAQAIWKGVKDATQADVSKALTDAVAPTPNTTTQTSPSADRHVDMVPIFDHQ
ncbi:hypothetical protein FRB93_004323 [Tulasnella sp. JGI-2019a]|nr:hypothetical protein FRB93_004323 [Tulasnella sp. JGI-2019a]